MLGGKFELPVEAEIVPWKYDECHNKWFAPM